MPCTEVVSAYVRAATACASSACGAQPYGISAGTTVLLFNNSSQVDSLTTAAATATATITGGTVAGTSNKHRDVPRQNDAARFERGP